ncbi:hypothetical protein GYMLUDRAFT_152128 [Collybiopsis luxurians FD-317 M1]|nr:hypothetical protein GYMLUDRAFT_152128 [Collybiopsis luxurians FD-317 M1]
MPQLAQSTYKCRRDVDTRWRLALQVLPNLRDRVADVIEDPLDRCRAGPFVLAHGDFVPRNIICASEGPEAGRILRLIDWEMSATVPLWKLVCYPSWFGQLYPNSGMRDPYETQLFKDTYIRELQRLTPEPFILNVVQNPRSEKKKVFAELALMSWPKAPSMAAWMNENSIGC